LGEGTDHSFVSQIFGKISTWEHSYRICSGRYMAEHSLFIAIASILQVFDILPATDSSGKEKPVEYELSSGAFVCVVFNLVNVIL
jgi:hypothetical protein